MNQNELDYEVTLCGAAVENNNVAADYASLYYIYTQISTALSSYSGKIFSEKLFLNIDKKIKNLLKMH